MKKLLLTGCALLALSSAAQAQEVLPYIQRQLAAHQAAEVKAWHDIQEKQRRDAQIQEA
jgi:hypothetical protein